MKNAIRWTAMACLTASLTTPMLITAPADAASGEAAIKLHADLNGDGHPDTITATQKAGNRVRISAKVGHGAVSNATVKLGKGVNFDHMGLRAGEMDGEPGEDLVYRFRVGAHTTFERALTWRSGLESLPAPKNGFGSMWVIDSSSTSVAGYKRHVTADGKTIVQARRAGRRKNGEFKEVIQVYRWSDGWKQIAATGGATAEDPTKIFGGYVGDWGNLTRW